MAAGLGAQWQAAQPQVRHAESREVEDLEPRRRDQPAQLRVERRFTLNTLMIGAPLTAAFVGLMAADDGVARDEAGSAEAEGANAGARAGGASPEPGQSALAAQPWEELPTGSPGPLLGLDGSTRIEVSGAAEPASTADLPDPGAGIETGPVQIPVHRAPADFGAEAAGFAGPQVSLTFFGVQAFEPLGDQQAGEPIPPEGGPIGRFVPGADGDEVIIGTEGDDFLMGGAGDDEIRGLGGDDILEGGPGNDRLFGGAGNDRLEGGAGDDEVHGGIGDDLLFGDLGTDAGSDRLFGGAGSDILMGREGDDLLDGGTGVDEMVGGPGDDILIIDNINDVAIGDGPGVAVPGNNTLIVRDAFATQLFAELGEERATFVFGESLEPAGLAEHRQQVAGDIQNITLGGTANHDVVGDSRTNVIRGNAGDNVLHGMAGDDILAGGGGADQLNGGAGDDILEGDAGDDILFGGAGDDELFGGAGDDILEGGTGKDRLFGGPGDDTFVIGLHDNAIDSVFDHEAVNGNLIRLEGVGDGPVEAALIGDQLQIIVDKSEVATVEQFRGHEDAFRGIDFGQGPISISSLLVSDVPGEPDDSPDPGPKDDVLDDFLPGPTLGNAGDGVLEGTSGADELLGTSGDDWLRGNAADDLLEGKAGNDVLEGGLGRNTLVGGPGDDLYLFSQPGENHIDDAEGTNAAEFHANLASTSSLQAIQIGSNLKVFADNLEVFEVENFVGNEQAFAGVWVGEQFVTTEDLVAGFSTS